MITYTTHQAASLRGTIHVPGDKSISHRSMLLGSIAIGSTHVTGFLPGEDNRATLQIMRAMGVRIDEVSATELVVHGVGLKGLKKPAIELDCGNAGTAMRLMAGLLAGQPFDSVLTGDHYLLKRPMRRVTEPLTQMGARIQTTEPGTAPLHIQGSSHLHGIVFDMPVASAQVKSCLLLAGLYALGETNIIEHGITRDHTERMLVAMGYPIAIEKQSAAQSVVRISGGGSLTGCDINIPGDISSAAFFMVAAAISNDAEITIRQVGVNPTRDGVIQILRLMGAHIDLVNHRLYGDEPVADIIIHSSALHGIEIPEALVPLAIDELPVLMIAAARAKGKTVLRGAHELRVKETDRIAAMAEGLRRLGIVVDTFEDGMNVEGGVLEGGVINSHGDHRIAMAFAIAGSLAKQPIIIHDCDNVATSFPGFVSCAEQVGIVMAQH